MQCPNCGAANTNPMRCEYCGTMLGDPKLQHAMVSSQQLDKVVQKYAMRGFSIVRRSDTSVDMEKGVSFNTTTMIILLVVLWPAAVFYATQASRKKYQVSIACSPDGSVREMGSTLEVIQNDRLVSQYKLFKNFGILLLVIGIAGSLLYMAMMITGPGEGGTSTPAAFRLSMSTCYGIFGLPTLAGGIILLAWRKKIANQLRAKGLGDVL